MSPAPLTPPASPAASPGLLHRLARPRPDVEGFATIAAAEAMARGALLSVFPMLMHRVFGSATVVSEIYFAVGLISLATILAVPQLMTRIRRQTLYRAAMSLYLVTSVLGMVGGKATGLALLTNAMAAAASFVCYNAYVLDYIPKSSLQRLETARLFYGGVGWTVGPFLGVWLLQVWTGAPFVVTGLAGAVMLYLLWQMQPGGGTRIARRRVAPANPLRFLPRFFAQPRLVAGYSFALVRSCGWWVFIVYLGIYAVERGLPEWVGGLATSAANAGLFLAPLMLRWVRRRPVREAVRTGFLLTASAFILAGLVSPWPWATITVLMTGVIGLILLDLCGGLPFLMSVKPSERGEMSAVYSSFRDVSGVVTPGVAWLTLQVAPLPAVFVVCGLAMAGEFLVAGTVHPRLGTRRTAPAAAPVSPEDGAR